ncbi:LOW QUALITY PROTEIN: histo-blood group ABO system transferase 2-like [Dryobates pubescens]|uniref:LOW QUALITY PROTEIN: histo-blood group ABO system transferase 2-like n=1 Tax=Dryobates pubescens TaxID=118200 RepID=UPI0023B89002|nr:LOW QUALITY PROTEIN: histo-blood group ABO system transferase 2-like [Dryobates pubescens]
MSVPNPCTWRRDVLVLTPWLTPVVWGGTFNREILNAQYVQKNLVTGVVTFAVKRYVQFIEGFMSSAKKYFLAGHQVNFYLFTDSPEQISHLQMGPENHLFVIPVQNDSGWQDVSMSHMDIISRYICIQFQYQVDYLYSIDVDVQLFEHVGVEIIDTLVETISSWQYTTQRDSKPYETCVESQAAVPRGKGDFYYTASFYGGSVAEGCKLTRACFKGLLKHKEKGIEARWHNESHLNKYLLYHKPTRLLSPEYYWDEELRQPRSIQVRSLSPVHKDSRSGVLQGLALGPVLLHEFTTMESGQKHLQQTVGDTNLRSVGVLEGRPAQRPYTEASSAIPPAVPVAAFGRCDQRFPHHLRSRQPSLRSSSAGACCHLLVSGGHCKLLCRKPLHRRAPPIPPPGPAAPPALGRNEKFSSRMTE